MLGLVGNAERVAVQQAARIGGQHHRRIDAFGERAQRRLRALRAAAGQDDRPRRPGDQVRGRDDRVAVGRDRRGRALRRRRSCGAGATMTSVGISI